MLPSSDLSKSTGQPPGHEVQTSLARSRTQKLGSDLAGPAATPSAASPSKASEKHHEKDLREGEFLSEICKKSSTLRAEMLRVTKKEISQQTAMAVHIPGGLSTA